MRIVRVTHLQTDNILDKSNFKETADCEINVTQN